MPKTEFQKKIEKSPQGALIAYCDQRHLDHTGNREAKIARLVAWEKAQSKETETEPEPEPKPVVEPVAPEPEPEPKVEPPEPEPETPAPEE